MRLDGRQVAVVGAAIGGASAALLLARLGAKVTLFERVSQPRAVGAGILLQPNGLAVLYGLGLRERLDAHAVSMAAAKVADQRGRKLLSVALPPAADGLDRALLIRRSDLHEALLDAVAGEPGISLRLGTEIRSVAADGTIEGEGRFELIVGADGVRSRVRESLEFGAKIGGSGIAYLRGLSGRELARNEEAWTAAGIFGSFAVPGGTYFFCSAASEPVARAVATRDLATFKQIWARAYPPSVELLAEVDSFDRLLLNEVIRVDCARYVDGVVALLGDAAHAMAPNLGQGANSALVDAAVLADELDRADDLATALRRYDARRRPKVKAVQDAAGQLGAVSDRTGAGFRWVRNRALATIGRFGMKRRLEQTLQEPPAELLAMVQRLRNV